MAATLNRMRVGHKDLDSFYQHAETLLSDLKADDRNLVWLHYAGDFSEHYINALTSRIERMSEEGIADKPSRKRFLSIFFEAIQNVRNHGLIGDNDKLYGALTIHRSGDEMFLTVMNIVSNKQAQLVQKKYREAGSYDRAKLKQIYMDVMSNGELSEKGGAGLGVLTITLKSERPVKTAVKPIGTNFQFLALTIGMGIKEDV